MRYDINQEDIASALKEAGSTRRYVDRQDYVTVLKELGDGHEYIDDQDLSEFIIGTTGTGGDGDSDMKILRKSFPNMVGVASQDLFIPVGGFVGVQAWAKLTTTFVAPDFNSKIEVGVVGNLSWLLTLINMTDEGNPAGEMHVGNWGQPSPSFAFGSLAQQGIFIAPGTNIKLSISGPPITAGGWDICVLWFPADEGATLVAA
jgi:hypothetical protein